MSEYSSRLSRGAFVSAVFAMQGVGILTAAMVSIVVTACFNGFYPSLPFPADDMAGNPALYYSLIQQSVPKQSDYIWRIVLGFGFFPAACTLYLRSTMPETPRYTLHVLHNKAQLEKDMSAVNGRDLETATTKMSTKSDMTYLTFLRRHGRELIGCAVCWFMLDVAFYSQNLFQGQVFIQIGFLPPGESLNAMVRGAGVRPPPALTLTFLLQTETFRLARAQALIALASTIPGYYATVFTVDFLGRIKIQYFGFAMMTCFMAAIAGGYNGLLNPNNDDASKLNDLQPDRRNGFVAMYALAFFFANFGPNATTFVIPAELFPTKWKATGHGMSAAAGKAGAIIGAFGFLYASQPAEGEVTWKLPCTNSPNFEYVSFATGNNQWIMNSNFTAPNPAYVAGAGNFATLNVAGTGVTRVSTNVASGPTVQVTAYFQNLAVPGTPLVPTSAGTLVQGPTSLKVSNVLFANASLTLAQAQALFIDNLNKQVPNACATCYGNVKGCVTNQMCTAPAQVWFANPVNGIYGNGDPLFSAFGNQSGPVVNGTGVAAAAVGQPSAQTEEGIANTQTFSFPQLGLKGSNIQTVSNVPINSQACLVKPSCPGGLIGTPATNNGKASYKCICPVPAPASGCFNYGIGIQGSLGVLAATNFIGMLFTALLPETNGKTLEQLNGETEDEVVAKARARPRVRVSPPAVPFARACSPSHAHAATAATHASALAGCRVH